MKSPAQSMKQSMQQIPLRGTFDLQGKDNYILHQQSYNVFNSELFEPSHQNYRSSTKLSKIQQEN